MAENELQKIIKGIFSLIKEKYGYTEEQVLIYLQGYQDCAEENQQSLEKRDKMLRDTVAELVEAKRLLKTAVEDIHKKCSCEGKDCDICIYEITCDYDSRFTWRYEAEALKLIGER